MSEVLSLSVPLFGLILLGVLAGRSRVLATNGRRTLDWLLLKLALPALLFGAVAGSTPSALNQIPFFLTVTFGTYCAFAIAFTASALRNRGDIRTATLGGSLGSHGALAHIGPALVLPAFGEAAALPFAIVFLLEGVLIRFLLPVMWAVGGRERAPLVAILRSSALSVLREPALVAVALGIVVASAGITVPNGLDQALDLLGTAAAPVGLLGLGLALASYRASMPRGGGRLTWSSSIATKLFVHPAIVYLLVGWVGDFDPAWMMTALFLAALPPAWNTYAGASDAGSRGEANAVAATGLIVSIVTITALIALTVTGTISPDPFPAGN